MSYKTRLTFKIISQRTWIKIATLNTFDIALYFHCFSYVFFLCFFSMYFHCVCRKYGFFSRLIWTVMVTLSSVSERQYYIGNP